MRTLAAESALSWQCFIGLLTPCRAVWSLSRQQSSPCFLLCLKSHQGQPVGTFTFTCVPLSAQITLCVRCRALKSSIPGRATAAPLGSSKSLCAAWAVGPFGSQLCFGAKYICYICTITVSVSSRSFLMDLCSLEFSRLYSSVVFQPSCSTNHL